jgi:hypothetical protein
MSKISKVELKLVEGSFQKDKILGLDGWVIDFYLDFYDFLEEDLLKIIEEYSYL